MAGHELVEHIDAGGNVLDVVTRSQMREQGLRHRCTYIAVVTSADELVVHQRAEWKDVYPGWWDIAFGGVCAVGEGWLPSAERELAEEAGIAGVPLVALGSVSYDGPDGSVLGQVFLARTDAELSCPDGEVVAVDHVPLGVLGHWLDHHEVCLDSLQAVLPVVLAHLKNP